MFIRSACPAVRRCAVCPNCCAGKAEVECAVTQVPFNYTFTVKDIPAGAKLVRVWVPVAHSDDHQSVRLMHVTSPVQTRMTEDAEYGNHILYAEIHNPVQSSVDFSLQYEVTRKEYSRGDYAQLAAKNHRAWRHSSNHESLH